jgi:competence protein ComEC
MRQIAMSWGLGIVACQFLSDLPPLSWLVLSLHCFLLILFKNNYLKNIGIVGLGFLYALWTAHTILNQDLPIDLEGKMITINGQIVSIPQFVGYGMRFEFEVEKTPTYPSFKARLTWNKDFPKNLQLNQKYKLKVRLKRAHSLRNFNTFDQERWFFQNRIRSQGNVKSGELLEAGFDLRSYIYMFLKEKINELPRSGILIALILGETNGISQQEWQTFRNTGTIHLISVSGTHLSMVAFSVSSFLLIVIRMIGGKWLLTIKLQVIVVILSFLVVAIYAWLSGFSIPTQRSLIMIGGFFLGIILNKNFASSYILSIAFFLILLIDPLAVLSMGFWLSFGAIATLLYTQHKQITHSNQLVQIESSWVVFIALTPLLLFIFGQIPLLSIISNVIVVSFFSFIIMPCLFLGAIFSMFEIGNFLLFLSSYCLDNIMIILEFLANLEIALLPLPNAPMWGLRLATIGTFLVLMPRGMIGKWIGFAWFIPMLFPHLEQPKHGEIYFDLLDVGQGLSAVIQTQHHVLIYDTAPAFEKMVIAESTLIPFLRGKGIQEISRLVISHPHTDHAGGVKSLIQAFEINDILTTEPTRWQHASYCKSGQIWEWDDVTFEILAGEENYYKNNSCVLKITTGKHSILLTGDIERDQELKLAFEKNIKANILIAPHHGSKTSSTHTFINAVKPDYALFSVGYQNQFKHPRSEIIQRYQSVGAQTFETQNSGMISFQITPETISKPQRYREINRHYWHR